MIENLLKKLTQTWCLYILLALVIFLIYAPSLFYNVVNLDDQVLVKESYKFNKDLSNIPQAFKENIFRDTEHSYYRPLLRLSFMMDAQAGEKNIIFMSHLTNVLLHIGVMCLLFYTLLKFKIKKEVALLFALFFGIHPLTTQTVSWIAGRNDSLLAIFTLPSVFFFIDYVEQKKIKYLIFHILFLTLALFTKETAVVIPGVLLFYLFIFIDKSEIKRSFEKYIWLIFLWLVIYILYFIIRNSVLENFVVNERYDLLFSLYRNGLVTFIPFIGKIFLPFDLSVYPVLEDMSIIYGILSVLVFIGYFIISRDKKYKLIVFGILWFVIFLIPTLIQPTNSLQIFAEHRVYIPMFGFAFIIMGLGKVNYLDKPQNNRVIFLFFAVLILFFAFATINRNNHYKDMLSFWTNAVETSPSNSSNYINLGVAYNSINNIGQAEYLYKKALVINPKERFAHYNLGLIYENSGKNAEALIEYTKELEINPDWQKAKNRIEGLKISK